MYGHYHVCCRNHEKICERYEIQRSASDTSSPWQNGYMERWSGNFKTEPGQLNQFQDVPQLHEAIALQIRYDNHERIHSALGMSPAAYGLTLRHSKPKRLKKPCSQKEEP